jgi:hypothetical protein
MTLDEIKNVIGLKDIILDVVPLSDCHHPASVEPCLVMIKAVGVDRVCVIHIDTYDSSVFYTKSIVSKFLNKLKNRIFCFSKRKVLHQLNVNKLYDLCLVMFMETGEIIEQDEYDTSSHLFFKNKYTTHIESNKIIPSNNHISRFVDMCEDMELHIKKKYEESYFELNGPIIETLQQIEANGLQVNMEEFKKHFPDKKHLVVNNKVYTEYNIFTSTGRPSNRFGGINYSALNKENECRKSFVSRFGNDGLLVMLDYSAYHPHIIGKLIKYNFPEGVNIYEYLARYYFKTEDPSEDQVKRSKTLTFQQLYGTISPEYAKIPYFMKILEYINHRWEFFNDFNYIETPIFKRPITSNHLKDASPNKLFNYILQASETEYSIKSLMDVTRYLSDKQTKPILYTYDSVLYDVYKPEGKEIIKTLTELMENQGFPTKCYYGTNYHEMKSVSS